VDVLDDTDSFIELLATLRIETQKLMVLGLYDTLSQYWQLIKEHMQHVICFMNGLG
jgi:hypothetical protein